MVRLWAAVAAIAMLGHSVQAQERFARLPRAVFDVIAPSERVSGERGTVAIRQSLCRIGATAQTRRRIVDIAVQEWAFFGFQTIDASSPVKRLLPLGLVADARNPALSTPRIVRSISRLGTFEDSQRVDLTIAGYWSATPEGARILRQQNRAWQSEGGEGVNWLQPWSAAFVSWVMCEAGLGEMAQFARSIAHRIYIDQAIAARDGADEYAAFEAYDSGERSIVPGDLLCNARAGADYQRLADRRADFGAYAPTHCDIVVKVDLRGERVLVIGGNVLDSVSLTILPLQGEGSEFPQVIGESTLEGARTVFTHLVLRAGAIEGFALDSTPTIRALAAP